jgi:hypothetical protein
VPALALSLAACGSSAHVHTAHITPIPKVKVVSPAVVGEQLPALYTCDGRDIPPPLEWGQVPGNVKQLALFAVGFTKGRSATNYKISVEWAVAGLKPTLHRISAGELPPGAFLGVAKGGKADYSICPPDGKSIHYQFELYGVPSVDNISHKFSGRALLYSLISRSGAGRALSRGGFVANYKRQ